MTNNFVITDSIDSYEWDCFVNNHPNGNIFHTKKMAQVWDNTKNRDTLSLAVTNHDGKILALLQALIVKERSDLLGKFSSRSVIHGGPLFLGTVDGKEASIFLLKEYDRLVRNRVLYSQIRNLWDNQYNTDLFQHLNYQYEEHLNFIIDLDPKEENLWQQIKKSRKYGINTAKKCGLLIEEITDISMIPIIYEIIQETYKIAQIPLADISLFESAFTMLTPQKMIKIFVAKMNENYIGTIILLLYRGVAYNWYSAAYKQFLNMYPNDLLYWHAILWCKENGYHLFDMGGAGKPNVPYGPREFKKQFGGQVTNYGRYHKVYSSVTLKLATTGFKLYNHVVRKC